MQRHLQTSFEFNSFLKALFYFNFPPCPSDPPPHAMNSCRGSFSFYIPFIFSNSSSVFSRTVYFFSFFLYPASVISIPLFSNSMPSPSFGNWFNSARSHWYSSSSCFGNVAKELIDFLYFLHAFI